MKERMVHVWVKESTRDKLAALKKRHETHDDVISDLIDVAANPEKA